MKIVIINTCDECPYFDNQYYSYEERCFELDRVIQYDDYDKFYPIPDDCPLSTPSDGEIKKYEIDD